MGERHQRGYGDAMTRDKSKGGTRNIPSKGDGVGGNIMALNALVQTIRDLAQDKFVGARQYEDIPGASENFQKFVDFMSALYDVAPDEARERLFGYLGDVVNIMRECCKTKTLANELDQRLNDLAAEKLRQDSTRAVKSSANEFMDALADWLKLHYEELIKLMGKYKKAADSFNQKKVDLERLVDNAIRDAEARAALQGVENLKVAFFFAKSRLVELEKKLEADFVTDDKKTKVRESWNKVQADRQWILRVQGSFDSVQRQVSDHQDDIELAEMTEIGEIRRQINNIKTEIESIRKVFVAVGKESIFWGCVFGLHEVSGFNPAHLLVYRVDLDSRSLPEFDFQKYQDSCRVVEEKLTRYLGLPSCQVVAEAMSSAATPAKDDGGEVDDDEQEEDIDFSAEPASCPSDHRLNELIEMSMCVLWGLINNHIERANLAGKAVSRQGDFGRMPRKVAKLLKEIGDITKDEQVAVRETVAGILVSRGLATVKIRKSLAKKYKTGECCYKDMPYLFLTEQGRAMGKKLAGAKPDLVKRILEKYAELEERYIARHVSRISS